MSVWDDVQAEKAKPGVWDQVVKPPTTTESVVRGLKQVANIPAEVIKGTVASTVGGAYDLFKQITTPLGEVPPEPGELGQRVAAKIPVPEFDIAPAASTGQQVGDVAVGAAKFAAEIVGLQKAAAAAWGVETASKIPQAVLWGWHAYLNGENPAVGAAMGKTFGYIDRIPADKLLGKMVKRLVESGSLAGITAVQGGTPVEIATSAAIPTAFSVGGKAYKAFKQGPHEAVPGPDIIRRGQPGAPQEPPAVASAEGTIPAVDAQQQVAVESRARLAGQFAAEKDNQQAAYDDLLDAIGDGDKARIAAARAEYVEAGPPRQAAVREASDAGHPEAQARLNEGFFKTDEVDTTTPLTKHERAIAKRMGYGKALTGRGGPMTPGQIRLIIQGDQGALAAAPKPEPEPEVVPGTVTVPEKRTIAPPEKEPKTELDKELKLAETRQDEASARRVNRTTGEISIGKFRSSRYALSDVSSGAGFDIGRYVRRIYNKVQSAGDDVIARHKDVFDKLGVPTTDEGIMDDPIWSKTIGKSSQELADMRHSGDWSRATPGQLEILNKLAELDARVNAPAIRRLKFKLWEIKGEVPEPLRGDPKEAERILKEGQEAKKNGTLDAWLAEQTWGAKKDYFMQEKHADLTAGVYDLIFGDRSAPSLSTGTAKTRKAETKAVRTNNILLDTIRHGQAIEKASVVLDEMLALWAKTQAAPFSEAARAQLKRLYKNAIGKPEPVGDLEQIAAKANRLFWNLKFADPRYTARWGLQNILQLPYMATHFTPGALKRGASALIKEVSSGQRDPGRLAATEEYMGSKSRENQELIAVLKDAEGTFNERHPDFAKLTRPIRDTFRAVQRVACMADPMVRELSFNVYYAGAKDALARHQAGKIGWNEVSKELKLRTMDPTAYTQVDFYVRRGSIDKAASEIARAKTADTHGEYGIIDRSMAEQTVMGRVIAGPMVFPRSILEMTWRNGIRPAIDGWKHNDPQMVWQGAKALLATSLVTYGVAKTYEAVTGKTQSILSNFLVTTGPGLDLLFGLWDELQKAIYQADQQNMTTAQTALTLGDKLVTSMEHTIPTLDAVADFYEAQHNVKGVRLCTLLKSRLRREWYIKYHRQWKPAERTAWEGIMHIITGGFEQGARQRALQARQQERKPL